MRKMRKMPHFLSFPREKQQIFHGVIKIFHKLPDYWQDISNGLIIFS